VDQAWTLEGPGISKRKTAWLEEPVQWYDQLQGLSAGARRGVDFSHVAGQGKKISRFGCQRNLALAGAVDTF